MKKLLALLLSLIIPLLASGCQANERPLTGLAEGTLEVHFIDVGQADAALLLCGGESMLIDGGNVADSSLVVSYLETQGVETLDWVIDTHAHEDHVGGLAGALAKYGSKRVLAPVTEYDSKAFRDFLKYTEELTVPAVGDNWDLGSAQVSVLGPVEHYDETNDTSIVLRVDFGETSFLFTGDMERSAEKDLLDNNADLSATVLKAGHHGSDTSTSYPFLRAVAPTYTVISVGEGNSYGHPSQDVLSRLRDADTQVWRTDMQGNIIATSDGAQVSFVTERNSDIKTNPTAPTMEPMESIGESYIGNLKSKAFHKLTCSSLPDEGNRIAFQARSKAIDAGYTPCGRCKP